MRPVSSSSQIPDWVTVINYAESKRGTHYLWGGNCDAASHGRCDCSGLTKTAYALAGLRLPRVAQDQYTATNRHPRRSELLPGDLVFFGTRYNLHHVAIYVGKDKAGQDMMIHAPRTGRTISYDRVNYMSDYYGATRVARDY